MARPLDFACGDHYAVLGIPRGASDAEISRAYKTLARRHHPDKNQGNEAAELSFKRIGEAYAVLRDPVKRREYDVSGGTQSYVSYAEAETMWRTFCNNHGEQDTTEGLPASVPHDTEARRKATFIVVVIILFFVPPQTMTQLLPGVVIAVAGLALFARREPTSKWVWLMFALLLARIVVPWMLRTRSNLSAVPDRTVLPQGLAAGAMLPHSGEEVMISDGEFVRIPDPQHIGSEDLQVYGGWQQRLIGSMAAAIREGREQVLALFSRQSCPWCDRQLPVLQRAIQQRTRMAQSAEVLTGPPPAEPAPKAAFTAPMVADVKRVPLLDKPLRVFVIDTEEFPGFAEKFNVKGVPTTVAWGSPGVAPRVAEGYLDDQKLEQLLKSAAFATPPGPEANEKVPPGDSK